MKRLLLSLVFLFALLSSITAQNYSVTNQYGVDCFVYTVQHGESLFSIAARYYVRPSTLALVNNMDGSTQPEEGQKVYVPLTETNFFKTEGIQIEQESYKPISYLIQPNDNLDLIEKEYHLNRSQLTKWNPEIDFNSLRSTDNIIIGFVKQNNGSANPTFIEEQKKVYGTKRERLELSNQVNKDNRSKTKLYQRLAYENFIAEDYLEPEVKLPDTKAVSFVRKTRKGLDLEKEGNIEQVNHTVKKEEVSRTSKDEFPQYQAQDIVKTPMPITQGQKEDTAKVELAIKQDSPQIESPLVITKMEKELITRKEIPTAKGGNFSHSIKQLTKNSYARNKEIEREKVAQAKKESEALARRNKKVVQNKLLVESSGVGAQNPQVQGQVEHITKVNAVPEKIEIEEDVPEPTYIENKLQRLSLLKSMTGKASFFYSGMAGAKFYVFTNLGKKGDIVKISNPTNHRFILAEIIDALPMEDYTKGVVIKISDNARLPLGEDGKYFNAKLNY